MLPSIPTAALEILTRLDEDTGQLLRRRQTPTFRKHNRHNRRNHRKYRSSTTMTTWAAVTTSGWRQMLGVAATQKLPLNQSRTDCECPGKSELGARQ